MIKMEQAKNDRDSNIGIKEVKHFGGHGGYLKKYKEFLGSVIAFYLTTATSLILLVRLSPLKAHLLTLAIYLPLLIILALILHAVHLKKALRKSKRTCRKNPR